VNEQDFIAAVGSHRLLTQAEEAQLAGKIRAGGEEGKAAKQMLILHNMRLLITEAKKYQHRGIEFEDLVQSAVIGLNRAAELFDERKGFRFSTYATMWIHQALQRTTAKNATIAIPDLLQKVRRTDAHNPGMTVEQIAEKTSGDVSARQVRTALNAARVVASLDAPGSALDEEGQSYYESIADLDADDPTELANSGESDWVREFVEDLPADQRQVIEMKFGLNGYGGKEHTLDEIAEATGQARDVVGRLQLKGMASLRKRAVA
jgi:RNA polymerase primary sigma factor